MNAITNLLLVLAFSALFPVATIWSLNTLFALNIVLSLETWAATFWLTLLFASVKSVAIQKENS